MSGTTRKMAGKPGAIFIAEPAISRAKAGEVLGQEVPHEAWQLIRGAIAAYHERLQDLTSSKASQKKDDPQGWGARQAAAVKHLERALDHLQAAREGNGEFLHEASENYSLQTFGYSAGPERSAVRAIDRAFREAFNALTIVERARPLDIETPSEATARDMAVRDIFAALTDHGIKVRASTGRGLDALARQVRLSDLTAFERLLVELQIGDGKKPGAFAAFVRGALAGRKQG